MKEKSCFPLAGVLAGMLGTLNAGVFVPPAEGPVPFRRDRVPLNAVAMEELSRDLGLLAGGMDAPHASDRRRAAQLLALALALDPENASAPALIEEYTQNRHQAAENDKRPEHSEASIQQIIAWLETPATGTDGQALAACLKDVIPSDRKSAQAEASREQGAWAGWVAATSAYEPKEVVNTVKPKPPEPTAPPQPPPGVLLKKAEVLTPMWQRDGNNDSASWIQAPAPLQMTATKVQSREDQAPGFSIVVANTQDSDAPEQGIPEEVTRANLGKKLKKLLKHQQGRLPQGVRISITSPAYEKAMESGKPQQITAAAVVLASAAITGDEPEAIILGEIDNTGAYTLPARFWFQLQELGKGNGQRLVLPTAATDYLQSILAMENPGFFIQYEVVLAADLKQLLELSAKKPPEPLATASAKFHEIHERAENQDIRNYIDNSFVKQHLAGVLKEMPTHISAKMLLTQASGNRPIHLVRKVLASELQRVLESMAWILTAENFVFDDKIEFPGPPMIDSRVNETFETCRAMLERLERYTDKNDRDLFEITNKLVTTIRTLDRAPRARGKSNKALIHVVKIAHRDLVEQYRELSKNLTASAKESEGG